MALVDVEPRQLDREHEVRVLVRLESPRSEPVVEGLPEVGRQMPGVADPEGIVAGAGSVADEIAGLHLARVLDGQRERLVRDPFTQRRVHLLAGFVVGMNFNGMTRSSPAATTPTVAATTRPSANT